jgi:hypothetical protein
MYQKFHLECENLDDMKLENSELKKQLIYKKSDLNRVNRGEILPPDDDAFRKWHIIQKQKHK